MQRQRWPLSSVTELQPGIRDHRDTPSSLCTEGGQLLASDSLLPPNTQDAEGERLVADTETLSITSAACGSPSGEHEFNLQVPTTTDSVAPCVQTGGQPTTRGNPLRPNTQEQRDMVEDAAKVRQPLPTAPHTSVSYFSSSDLRTHLRPPDPAAMWWT